MRAVTVPLDRRNVCVELEDSIPGTRVDTGCRKNQTRTAHEEELEDVFKLIGGT